MNQRVRFALYLLVFGALALIVLAGPVAWATPGQSPENQTVPTRTPRPPEPPPQPTEPSEPPPQPTQPSEPPEPEPEPATAVPVSPTSTPGVTPALTSTPTPTVAAVARLQLKKQALPDQVWPGATVKFTLVLSNPGSTSARQVVLEDVLPPSLQPGAILQGDGAAWDGRTLRALVAVLPPGGNYTTVFTAVVKPGLGSETRIVNEAVAVTAGQTVRATAVLALPPLELPPVGGVTFDGRSTSDADR